MTAEQKARDLLDRLGVDDARSYTAGDLVELANLIAERDCLEASIKSISVALMDHGKILRAMEAERDALAAENALLKRSLAMLAGMDASESPLLRMHLADETDQ